MYFFNAYSKTAPVSPTRYPAINFKQWLKTLLTLSCWHYLRHHYCYRRGCGAELPKCRRCIFSISSSSITIKADAFKLWNKPVLISLPTRDIADFAYLLFFDSGGISLMNYYMYLWYVWRNVIKILNDEILQWHERGQFRELKTEKFKKFRVISEKLYVFKRLVWNPINISHHVRLHSISNCVNSFENWILEKWCNHQVTNLISYRTCAIKITEKSDKKWKHLTKIRHTGLYSIADLHCSVFAATFAPYEYATNFKSVHL